MEKMGIGQQKIDVACNSCNFSVTKDWEYICSDECAQKYGKQLHSEAKKTVTCTDCEGSGEVNIWVTCGECTNGSNECTTCKGTGKIMHVACSGNGYTIENNNCGHEGANGPHYYCTEHGLNIEQYHLGN